MNAQQTATLDQWLTVLTETSPDRSGAPYATFEHVPNPRGKYSRIVGTLGGQQSVHAFIDNDGNVYKAAGWKAPARGVRYTLSDPETLLRNASGGWAGGYLYSRAQQPVSLIG